MNAALPAVELLRQQAEWLAPARSRLLRQIGIAHRQRILDLGAGYGAVTGELVRRGGGSVVALDREWEALRRIDTAVPIQSNALQLPFAHNTFDLVFCQCVLLWLADVDTAVAEVQRVLQPGGVLAAIEPDYGGLMEYPPAIDSRALWLTALERNGAKPFIGRQLPALLEQAGFRIRVRLLDEITVTGNGRYAFLRTLPLTPKEVSQLDEIERTAKQLSHWQQIAHLPFFLITAEKA